MPNFFRKCVLRAPLRRVCICLPLHVLLLIRINLAVNQLCHNLKRRLKICSDPELQSKLLQNMIWKRGKTVRSSRFCHTFVEMNFLTHLSRLHVWQMQVLDINFGHTFLTFSPQKLFCTWGTRGMWMNWQSCSPPVTLSDPFCSWNSCLPSP